MTIRSVDSGQQRRWLDPKRTRQPHDGREPGIALGALQKGNLRSVQLAEMAEGFPRNAALVAIGPQIRRKLLSAPRTTCSVVADKSSTDKAHAK